MAQAYSDAERGGGQGDTGLLRAKILRQIDSWAGNARWEDPERAERIFDKMHEAPERFITPNPDSCGSYREEASRCYEEIKEEYGLRLASETLENHREHRERVDRRLREEIREQLEQFGADAVRSVLRGTGTDAPEECRERVRSVLESEGPDVYAEHLPERDHSAPEPADSPEPEPTEPERPAPDRDDSPAPEPAEPIRPPASTAERLGRMAAGKSASEIAAEIGHRTGRRLAGAARLTAGVAGAFARGAIQGARSA